MNKKVQKVDKTKPQFLVQKYHQFIFAALFELLMSHIYHRKKNDFGAENLTNITAKVREPFKNYLADFFRLGGGVPPLSGKLFWAQ